MQDYRLGDTVIVKGEGIGQITSMSAQRNDRGRSELRYRVQLPGDQERWVSLTDILGKVTSPPYIQSGRTQAKVPNRSNPLRRRPSKLRQSK